MELLCGVAAAWHRRAGEELERGHVLRCFEKCLGSSRESLQARAWKSKHRYGRISLKMALFIFTALCPKALALASRTVLMGGTARLIAGISLLRARWGLSNSDWSASA